MKQLTLFDNSTTRIQRLVSLLLWHANSNVPSDGGLRWRFYRLKDSLLRKFGTIDSEKHCDWQVITNYCWSCEGTGGLYEPGACYKCNGSGIYSRRWIPLARWKVAGRVFHIPGEAQLHKPEHLEEPDVDGRIQHSKSWFAWHAQLALGLMFDREFARNLLKEEWRDFRRSVRAKVSVMFRRVWHVARRCDVCRKYVGSKAWCESTRHAYCSEVCYYEAERQGSEVPF